MCQLVLVLLHSTQLLLSPPRGFISGTGNSLNRHLLVFLHDALVNQRHCVCQYQVYWFLLTVPYGIDRPCLPGLYREYTKQHSLTSIWNTCLHLSSSTYHCSPFLLAQNLTPKHVLPGGIKLDEFPKNMPPSNKHPPPSSLTL